MNTLRIYLASSARAALVWLFLLCFTAIARAQIVSVSPLQNALNVPLTTNISVTFSQAMNATTINDTTFRVWGMQSGLHQGAITYDAASKKATLTPTKPFLHGEIVSVTLTNRITSSQGLPISKFEWQFTTDVNKSTGKFAARVDYGAGSNPSSVFAADLDGDGDADLAVANSSNGKVAVLKNNGVSAFHSRMEYTVGGNPSSVFASDLDGDGDMDLTAANGSAIAILKNNGNGTFQPKVDYGVGIGNATYRPHSIFAEDFDGDGDIDLAVTSYYSSFDAYGGSVVGILKNSGDGSFQATANYTIGSYDSPRYVLAADFESDGDIDLVAGSDQNKLAVFKNNDDGTFEKTVEYDDLPASFPADLDADGDVDLATTVFFMKNNGDGTFQFSNYYGGIGPAYSVLASDWNGDGDLDLAAANGNTVVFLENNGDGTFLSEAVLGTGKNSNSLFASDLDRDGDMDLVATNPSDNAVSIFINRNSVSTKISVVHFGQVYAGNKKDLSFYVYNDSTSSVNITNITSNNANFTIDSNTSFTLPAGDSAKIAVSYAPTAAMSDTGTVMITANGLRPMRVYLRGTGIPPVAIISVSPPTLEFGNVTTTKAADLILNISNTGILNLNITNITHANPNFSILGGTTYISSAKTSLTSFSARTSWTHPSGGNGRSP